MRERPDVFLAIFGPVAELEIFENTKLLFFQAEGPLV